MHVLAQGMQAESSRMQRQRNTGLAATARPDLRRVRPNYTTNKVILFFTFFFIDEKRTKKSRIRQLADQLLNLFARKACTLFATN